MLFATLFNLTCKVHTGVVGSLSLTTVAMMKLCREPRKIESLILEHLKSSGVKLTDNTLWELRESSLAGVGVFAKRDVQIGEIIFEDCPVILGPRAVTTKSVTCVSCYSEDNLKACAKGCGLPVCSTNCENSSVHLGECEIILRWRNHEKQEKWSKKLLECLTPIRSLLLNRFQKELVGCLQCHEGKQHGFEVDDLKNKLHLDISPEDENFMRSACGVLDANAFEVVGPKQNCHISLRGLYPLGSLANHSCVPNAMHVFDDRQRMVVRAATYINKDSEIFHSYSRLIWGTVSRRFHLQRTKHFFCECSRCMDPTEFGTNLTAILCKPCGGLVLPKDTRTRKLEWECRSCRNKLTTSMVGVVLSVLGSWLEACSTDNVDEMLKCLEERVAKVAPDCNEIAVELKYRIIWILGYKEGYSWKGTTST